MVKKESESGRNCKGYAEWLFVVKGDGRKK